MKNWMTHVPGNTELARMAIPGTHNSGANGPAVFGRNQNWQIETQLEYGIRFLDIRLTDSPEGNAFVVKHGSVNFGRFSYHIMLRAPLFATKS